MATIYAEVNKTVLDQAKTIGNVHVIDTADGSVAGKTLVSEAEKVVAKDRNLQKAIDAAIEKEMKKRKIGQK
jgi:fatty acid-binding protein DegV